MGGNSAAVRNQSSGFASSVVHLAEKVKKPTENILWCPSVPYYFLCLKTISCNMVMNAVMRKQASRSHYFIANSFACACHNQKSSVDIRGQC